MKQKPSLALWIKRKTQIFVVFCCLFSSPLCVSPAHASGIPVFDSARGALLTAGWAMEEASWESIIDLLEEQKEKLEQLSKTLKDEFEKYEQVLKDVTAALNTAVETTSEAEVKTTQAIVDNNTANVLLAAQLEDSYNQADPKHEYLCKTIKGGQLSITSEDLEREGTDFIVRSVASKQRCKTCDGTGPKYAAVKRKTICREGVKFANAVTGDTTCVDTSGQVTSDGYPLAAMHELPITIGQVFVMPEISGSGGDRALDPKGDSENDQYAYMQKINGIELALGARPTVAWGKNMMTPMGRNQRALFNHCLALGNVLTAQHASALNFFTRPNCNVAGSNSLCAKQKERCLAATEGLIDNTSFGACEKGLSPYESLLIEHLMCKSAQHYVLQAAAHATFSDQLASPEKCSAAWESFQELVRVKYNNYTRAVAGMGKLDACWAAVEALGR